MRTSLRRTHKLPFSIFIMVFMVSPPGYGQNTWVVSNDPSFEGADFDDFQAAINAASPGDKIYVHGSTIQYGNVNVNKKLHLIGSGFWKSQNNIMDENLAPTIVSATIDLTDGSDSSIVEGFQTVTLNLYTDNVVIRYNQLCCDYGSLQFFTNPVNAMVYGNYIRRGFTGSAISALIFNNIFEGLGYTGINDYWENNDANIDCLVQNNAFFANTSQFITDCTFRNNIVRSPDFSMSNCAFQNNIFVDDNVIVNGLPMDSLGNDNIDSVDINTVWNLSDPSPDGKYRLIGDSNTNVAIGAGINGEDCGAFGGDSPYRLSGIVKVPTIYQMLIPLVGDTTNMLNIKIRAKSN